jgi:hypothetical protein
MKIPCIVRPLGIDIFISNLEKFLGWRVRPLPIGRPKNKKMLIWRTKNGSCVAVVSIYPIYPVGTILDSQYFPRFTEMFA